MKGRSPITRNEHIRVLLFSKYQIVQQSLKLLIESSRDLTVTGVYSPLDDLGSLHSTSLSDIAVVHLSSGDRLEFISELLEKVLNLRIVAIADGLDIESQAQLLKLGAFGIVQKEQGPELLIKAIRRTHSGETWLNHELLSKILGNGKANGIRAKKGFAVENGESLTARELEVIRSIGEGLKNKDIGKKLLISEATVRHHLSSIYGKVGVEDRLNLVIFAYERGLIEVSDNLGESIQSADTIFHDR